MPTRSSSERHVSAFRGKPSATRHTVRVDASKAIESVVADLLDRTPSITDLVPLFSRHPGHATLRLRDHLRRYGHELPTNR